MPELAQEGLAVTAGALAGVGVWVAVTGRPRLAVHEWPSRFVAALPEAFVWAWLWPWLVSAIDRAGWRETPERLVVLAIAVSACLAAMCGAIDPWLAPVGFGGGSGLALLVLTSSVERRRRRRAAELVPLLELFTLELSAGGSAMSALGSVSIQVDGELASELRRMLIASQVKGSASFESRLLVYADRIRLPALATLATTLGADRDFGTGASQGVRALARDLRRAQRRDLITHSRKALNHVLLPAAVGVLLPFLGVLMFPAVSVLQRSLR